jgi:hypothetical protein
MVDLMLHFCHLHFCFDVVGSISKLQRKVNFLYTYKMAASCKLAFLLPCSLVPKATAEGTRCPRLVFLGVEETGISFLAE